MSTGEQHRPGYVDRDRGGADRGLPDGFRLCRAGPPLSRTPASGSAYYFAEKAFLDRPHPATARWARLAKFFTGWAAHLFYWVYPGVMVAFMAVLVTYIAGQFGVNIPIWAQIVVAWAFAALVGFIAVRGISGSTHASIVINVIQLTALVVFSVLAILFRVQNPLGVAAGGLVPPDGALDRHPAQPGGHAVPVHHRHPDPGGL